MPMPTGAVLVPPGQPHAVTQGPDSTSQLYPATSPAASAAMPSGLDGWDGGQAPGMIGNLEGAASGNAPATGQPHLEQRSHVRLMVTQDHVSSRQAGASVEREYTVNGKRKYAKQLFNSCAVSKICTIAHTSSGIKTTHMCQILWVVVNKQNCAQVCCNSLNG